MRRGHPDRGTRMMRACTFGLATLLAGNAHAGGSESVRRENDAMEFVARVLVQIPDPRGHLVRYYGFYSNVARGKRKRTEAPAQPSRKRTARPSGTDGRR
jgi:hypothetical protein